MITKAIAAMVAGMIGLALAAPVQAQTWGPSRCDPRDRNCDGRLDWRDRDRDWRDRDRRDYRSREPTYGVSGYCTFNTPRGPVRGYKPEGKDRCCIETRNGPSCQ